MDSTQTSAVNAFYAGRSPTLVPFYYPADVARYLRLPVSTVRSWVGGRKYSWGKEFKPVITPDDPAGKRLSFTNLVELHVLSVMRGHNVAMPNVRKMIETMQQSFGVERPLAETDFRVSGNGELYAEYLGQLMDANCQLMFETVRLYVDRIEREKGLLARLYPFGGEPSLDAPRAVVCDPLRRFGRPHIAGRGVETSILADLFKAGDDVHAIAEAYELRLDLVREALRFEGLQAA